VSKSSKSKVLGKNHDNFNTNHDIMGAASQSLLDSSVEVLPHSVNADHHHTVGSTGLSTQQKKAK
jgi:hypothetical protein